MACASPDVAGLACVLLAAGQGARFGSNKLLAPLDGWPLGLHAAATLAASGIGTRIAVVGPKTGLSDALAGLGFAIIVNPAPEAGQATSLRRGVEAAQALAPDARGLLVALADMPFVTPRHLGALTAAFLESGATRIAASTLDGVRMPPALFPRSQWPLLLAREGDRGAAPLLADAIPVAAPASELADVDTWDDLAAAGD